MSQKCAEAMVETINRATVCAYHAAATHYCETEVRAKCVKWLERRLTSETSVSLLKEIRWDITLSRFTVLGSSRHQEVYSPPHNNSAIDSSSSTRPQVFWVNSVIICNFSALLTSSV